MRGNWSASIAIVAALFVSGAAQQTPQTASLPFYTQPIKNSATLNVSVRDLWEAWTTNEGAQAWLAPAVEIDGRPGGVYRAIYNTLATRVIDRGNDGKIIAMEQEKLLVITWMTPLHMQELKGNSTVVVVHFHDLGPNRSRVDILNTGYGQGPLWEAAYSYNVKGWDRILSALEYRFDAGPMDWPGRVKELKETGKISYWRENRRNPGSK